MAITELISRRAKPDKALMKEVFQVVYPELQPLAERLAKNHEQASELLTTAFAEAFQNYDNHEQLLKGLVPEFRKSFLKSAVEFIKSIRSEYYLSSTVYAANPASANPDLFTSNEIIDFNKQKTEVLLAAIQLLVPAQRLVFNLHVLEGLSLTDTAAMLEASEGVVKTNLEKSRYNLQKNIEKRLKGIKS